MGILNIDTTITEQTLLDNCFKKAFVGYYGKDETGNPAILYANQFKKRESKTVHLVWHGMIEDIHRAYNIPIIFTYYHSNCFITPFFIKHHIKDPNGYITVKIDTDKLTNALSHINTDDFEDYRKITDVYDLNAFVIEKLKDVEAYIQKQISYGCIK